jgi:hypothetical protein
MKITYANCFQPFGEHWSTTYSDDPSMEKRTARSQQEVAGLLVE